MVLQVRTELEIIEMNSIGINNISEDSMGSESVMISEYDEVEKMTQKHCLGSTKLSQVTKSKFLQTHDAESASCYSSLHHNSTSFKRKQQNRESARKCRIRKKQRFSGLEKRQKDLQEQLASIRAECQREKNNLEKYISGPKSQSVFSNIGRAQAYDRLNKINGSQEMADEDEINLILDNLRYRVGATGTERQGKINYIFKQVIQISFPALHRYFMWSAYHNTEHFGDEKMDSNNWMKGLDPILNVTERQREIIRSSKGTFEQHFRAFSKLIDEMKETKSQLEKESDILENLIEDLRRMLTPLQCSKLITFIENNKYKSEMELWVSRNIRKFEEDEAPVKEEGGFKAPNEEGDLEDLDILIKIQLPGQ